jgi:translation initiation factor 1
MTLRVTLTERQGMGEVIQLQGDQRNKISEAPFSRLPRIHPSLCCNLCHLQMLTPRIEEFLTDKDNGLGLDGNTIKVHGF